MNKFCNNCGCVIDENTRFCPQCGTAAIETPAPAAVEETPVAPVEEPAAAPAASEPQRKKAYYYAAPSAKASPTKKKFNPKKLITILVSVLVIVGIGFGTFFLLDTFGLLGNFTYKGAMKLYFDCINNADVSKMEDMAPEAYWGYLEDKYDCDFDELQKSMEEDLEYTRQDLEEEYGEDYKFKYKIKSKSEVSTSRLKKIAKALKESYDIKASSVTKGYKLKVDFIISGSEGDDDDTSTIYVLKISGKWYLTYVTEYGDGYDVNFLLNP